MRILYENWNFELKKGKIQNQHVLTWKEIGMTCFQQKILRLRIRGRKIFKFNEKIFF